MECGEQWVAVEQDSLASEYFPLVDDCSECISVFSWGVAIIGVDDSDQFPQSSECAGAAVAVAGAGFGLYRAGVSN